VRDNRLGPTPANLRKGDELQEFYGAFKEMHASLRSRAEDDVRVIGNAVSVLEGAQDARSPAFARALEELRDLRKRKEDSLEKGGEDMSGVIRPGS